MFELIFAIAVAGYIFQSIIFYAGTKKNFPQIKEDEFPTATIIVAARNEEKNIVRCLESLNNLEFPEGKLEIIIVDDNSNDNTGELIEKFISNKPLFKKIITKKEIGRLKGKTNALANAIEIAKGDIILTTDADCAVNPLWAKTLVSYYKEDVAIVNGFTSQVAKDSFSGMQSLDFTYLLTVASGTININFPLSCIGNNMSFRKSAYFEVGGYENLPFSVTEDFNLLIAIHKLNKYKIIYPLDKNAHVESIPCKSFKELYRQKKRWGVGGLKVPYYGFFAFSNGVLTHLCIILLPFYFSILGLIFALIKILTDYYLLLNTNKRLGTSEKIKYFIAFQIYYIIYVIALPIVLLISRKVIWKERKY